MTTCFLTATLRSPSDVSPSLRPDRGRHHADRNRWNWAEKRQYESEQLGRTPQPYFVIAGCPNSGSAGRAAPAAAKTVIRTSMPLSGASHYGIVLV